MKMKILILILTTLLTTFATFVVSEVSLNFEKCSTSTTNCAYKNFKNFLDFMFKSNGSEIYGKEFELLDPFYQDYLLIKESLGAEVFQFTFNGLSNLQTDGLLIQENKFDDSFTIATKITFPSVNGTGDYKLKWQLGFFNFDADGELACEINDLIANFVVAGHYLKSGEIIFDDAEFHVVDTSKSHAHFTNLFNGNQFMERAGNAIINKNLEILSRPTAEGSLKKISKVLLRGFEVIFGNFTKAQFEELFPKSDEIDVIRKDDISVESVNLDFDKIASKTSQHSKMELMKEQIKSLYFFVQILYIIVSILLVLVVFISYRNFYMKKSSNKGDQMDSKETSETLLQQ